MHSDNSVDVTVIIPSHNRSHLVWEAINSCLDQKGLALEILVVDDASTDSTPQMLKNIGLPEVRVIVLEKNHRSGNYARNIGLSNARGRYIKFLDSDDILEPGTLLKEYRAAIEHNADMVMSGWGVIDEKKLIIDVPIRTYEPPQPEQVLEAIMGLRKNPYTAAVLYRHEYISDMEWDCSLATIDDFDWFCRTALKGGKLIAIKELSYWWRVRPGSIITSQTNTFFDRVKQKDRLYNTIERLLVERGQLTDKSKDLLAQQYYMGLRAFGRFNFSKFQQILSHILELSPGFRPTVRSEYNPLIRFAFRMFGIKATLLLYVFIRRGMDIFHPRHGEFSYFDKAGTKGVLLNSENPKRPAL